MRVLSDIQNTGLVDGKDIQVLDSNITSNSSSISSNASNISSLQSNVTSISSTLSTKAAAADLTTGRFNGTPLGKLNSVDLNNAANTMTLRFESGSFEVGVIFINPI